MNKTIYLVRHGKASGQAPEAPLTSEGTGEAEALAEFLSGLQVSRIISSPFTRAVQTIKPLADRLHISIEFDERLIEAPLSTIDYSDWLDKLRATFSDFSLSFEGGESSRVATDRGIAAVNEALRPDAGSVVLVTHGRLLALILKHFDFGDGFDEWQNLTTPDIFRLMIEDTDFQVERIWR